MKNTKLLLGMASICLASIVLNACGGSNSESTSNAPEAASLRVAANDCGSQDAINVDDHAISYADAKKMNDDFSPFFRDNRNMSQDLNFIDSIEFTAVTSLIEDFNKDTICKGHYVRGLAIAYGLDNGRLVNIYQPLLYDKAKQEEPTNHDYNVVYGDSYTWDGTQFNLASNANDLITEYQTNMQIKRDGINFTPYKDHDGDTEADNARANLMTEKELQELYNANHGNGSKLYFFPAARKANVEGVFIYKHDHVVAAVNNLRVAGTRSGWTVAVDDNHMPCPYTCGVIQLQ